MAFDDSHVRTTKQQAQDRADASAKQLMIDRYRQPFLAAIPRCEGCGETMQWVRINGDRRYACYRRECRDAVRYSSSATAKPSSRC
jgi:hypothetical protein